MRSPIADILEIPRQLETHQLFLGSQLYEITLPKLRWWYLDNCLWHGYDIEAFLEDCGNNLINDDPSYTLDLRLYWIGRNEHEEHGVKLVHREGV